MGDTSASAVSVSRFIYVMEISSNIQYSSQYCFRSINLVLVPQFNPKDAGTTIYSKTAVIKVLILCICWARKCKLFILYKNLILRHYKLAIDIASGAIMAIPIKYHYHILKTPQKI